MKLHDKLNPFKKMTKKQINRMLEVDVESRNLEKKESGAGNFLHLQIDKKVSA